MTYIASQIIGWILLAVVFGFLLGYAARGRRGGRSRKKGRIKLR